MPRKKKRGGTFNLEHPISQREVWGKKKSTQRRRRRDLASVTRKKKAGDTIASEPAKIQGKKSEGKEEGAIWIGR